MKIIIVNSLYYPYKFGGAEVSVQLLAEGLVARGITVKVITLNNKKEIERFNHNGVEVVSFPLRNIYWPFDKTNYTKIKKAIWHVRDYLKILSLKWFKKKSQMTTQILYIQITLLAFQLVSGI